MGYMKYFFLEAVLSAKRGILFFYQCLLFIYLVAAEGKTSKESSFI